LSTCFLSITVGFVFLIEAHICKHKHDEHASYFNLAHSFSMDGHFLSNISLQSISLKNKTKLINRKLIDRKQVAKMIESNFRG